MSDPVTGHPDADRGFEIRVSPDQRRVAVYEPTNAPWFIPVDHGRFVSTAEVEGWTEYVPADRDRRIAEMEAALDRVRDLHERHDSNPVPVCHECRDHDGNWELWPCPTIRAIDPEEVT